jgi:hypothetical protein
VWSELPTSAVCMAPPLLIVAHKQQGIRHPPTCMLKIILGYPKRPCRAMAKACQLQQMCASCPKLMFLCCVCLSSLVCKMMLPALTPCFCFI